MKCDELEVYEEMEDYVGYDNDTPTEMYDKSEADKMIAGLKARTAELEEERRWRKFPDEKPTKDIKFLVINEKGFMQCCYYSPILHEFQIPVTHWMPLPSAPKEEK